MLAQGLEFEPRTHLTWAVTPASYFVTYSILADIDGYSLNFA